ncbi:MAG: glycosyltransferase family 39 protein, partial [Blastocatellia bacterium]
MILQSVLWCLAPLLIALLLISVLWPEQTRQWYSFPLKLCFAVGVGFGLLSCVYFLGLSFWGPSRTRLLWTQLALLVILIAVLLYRRRTPNRGLADARTPEVSIERIAKSGFSRFASVLFVIALISAAVTLVFISLKKPHGDWDAWAVYNMKARFLFRGGAQWKDLFSQPMEWSGPDYPLLIPTAIAACWTLMGTETLVIPALVAILFTLATVGIAAFCVSVLRGSLQGSLAGLVLLGTPYLVTHGADQYSDIPIGFFFLATLALIHLHDQFSNGDCRFLVLAGLMAGLAAWTKNEGLLFMIAVVVSRFAVLVPRIGLKPYLREMRFLASGLLPILLVVIYFKLTISAHSGLLFPPEGPNFIAKLTNLWRYWTIFDYFVGRGLGFGNWPSPVVPLLAFYLLLLGIGIGDNQKRAIAGSLMALGIMLTGYFMIYVLSPRDLDWHLVTSLDRLYSQLWPSFIFVFFLTVRT